MAVRLAAAPITWGVCELPGWGIELPYDAVLDQMAALGFEGTELGPAGYLPADEAGLRATLDGRGLALVAAFCPLTLPDPALAGPSLQAGEDLARFLAGVGCRLLVAADAGDARRRDIAGRVTAADGLPADAWSRMGEGLATLARRCAPLGVRVVFHPHAGTYVETAQEVDWLLSATPPSVGLCLDTGHLAYGGADPVDVCRRYASRVWHVHAKDVNAAVLERVRVEGLDYATAVGEGIFAPLGQGVVDFPSLATALRAAGYDGWIVLEQDVRLGGSWPVQDPVVNAGQSRTYLRALVSASATKATLPGTQAARAQASRTPATGGTVGTQGAAR